MFVYISRESRKSSWVPCRHRLDVKIPSDRQARISPVEDIEARKQPFAIVSVSRVRTVRWLNGLFLSII